MATELGVRTAQKHIISPIVIRHGFFPDQASTMQRIRFVIQIKQEIKHILHRITRVEECLVAHFDQDTRLEFSQGFDHTFQRI